MTTPLKSVYRFNQNAYNIFHRTRTNDFKILMESQKTPDS